MNFLSIIWDPNEVLFRIGFFTLRYYSILFAVGFALGWQIVKKMFKKEGASLKMLDPLFMYVILATVIGARLGHYLFYDQSVFLTDPISIISPFEFSPKFKVVGFRGLASHGAAIAILISLYLYSRKISKTPFLWIVDRVVIPTALAGAFIRLGNFFNSGIIGKPTGTDFGVIYKKLGEDFPRYPTQLYESAGYLLAFGVLWYIYWKTDKSKQLGYIFGFFMLLIWSVRFVVEFWKEAQVDARSEWVLNTGQWLSIPAVLVGLYFIFRKPRIYQYKS